MAIQSPFRIFVIAGVQPGSISVSVYIWPQKAWAVGAIPKRVRRCQREEGCILEMGLEIGGEVEGVVMVVCLVDGDCWLVTRFEIGVDDSAL